MTTASNAAHPVPRPRVHIDRRQFFTRAAAAGVSLNLLAASLAGASARANSRSAFNGNGENTMEATSHYYMLSDEDAEAVWFLGCLALLKGVGKETGSGLATVEFLHPAGFATPLHVHHTADEAFYVLTGAMRGYCGGGLFTAAAGAFLWLPRNVPHGYMVDGDGSLRTLAITVPAGFENFVREAGEPAKERVLPPPAPPDIAKLNAASAKYNIENIGPLAAVLDAPQMSVRNRPS